MPFTAQDLSDLLRLLESDPQLKASVRAALWAPEDVVVWLREHLPRLLREDPRLASEVVGVLAQTLSPRGELLRVLEEVRLAREDFRRALETLDRRFELVEQRFRAVDERFEALQRNMDRRFEALQQEMDRRFEASQREMDRRFEALQQEMDRRFEALQQEMDRRFEALQRDTDRRFELQAAALASLTRDVRRLTVGMGSLGRRTGLGFEEAVRSLVEEFAGLGPLRAERLVLHDQAGEVFGVPGCPVEFDALVHDSRRFLVEVKAFADAEDVLLFHRKVRFAAGQIHEPFESLLVAPFAHRRALELAGQLGIRVLGREEGAGEDAAAEG